MASGRKNKKKKGESEKNKILVYFGFLVIFFLIMSGISYTLFNKSAKDGPEYIEERLVEFYEDSCQLNPKVGFKTINGLRGAYAKGSFKQNEQVLFGGQGLFLFAVIALLRHRSDLYCHN